MTAKIRAEIEHLFAPAPRTKQVVEMQEEIIQNVTDKYGDLLAEGKPQQAAYNIAMASLGDMDTLILELQEEAMMQEDPNYTQTLSKARQRQALLVTSAVVLYIFSLLPVILLQDEIGIVLFLAIAAVATGLLVYNGMTAPKKGSNPDGIADEFKEWREENDGEKRRRKAISSALTSLALVIFLLVGFTMGKWYIIWMVFPIAHAIEQIIFAVMQLKENR